MIKRLKYFFYFFICLHNFSFANKDSTQYINKSISTYFSRDNFFCTDSFNFIDNSLNDFHLYLPQYLLGNTGLVFSDLFYTRSNNSELGFRYFINSQEDYLYSSSRLNFFNTRSPYSDVFYVAGSKREQLFRMTFSYNVNKNWNLTANFSRIRSEGFYLRQNTNHNLISVNSNYKSSNNRYGLLFSFSYNHLKNAENGGIASDSIFRNSGAVDKKLFAVNLTSANKILTNRNIYLKQLFNLGSKKIGLDSIKRVDGRTRIELESEFDDYLIKYEDMNASSGFYNSIYIDSLNTFDSLYNYKLSNAIYWKFLGRRNTGNFIDKFNFSIGFKNELIRVKQKEIDTTFGSNIITLDLQNSNLINGFNWLLFASNGLSGYNKNNYLYKLALKKYFNDSSSFISVNGEKSEKTPDFINIRYSSNHFKWSNNFNLIGLTRLGLDLYISKLDLNLGTSYSIYNNPVYFDNFALSRQFSGEIPVFSAFLKKDFSFKGWHLNNKIIYQNVAEDVVIRLPEFVLNHSLYYENNLFKKAMHFQVGFSVLYVSEFYSNSYMPATGQFYFQNGSKYGDYPFIDFFINTRIKSVRVFFKIDHLNSGLMGNDYMLTPDYPINGRAFKLGVNWKFFD